MNSFIYFQIPMKNLQPPFSHLGSCLWNSNNMLQKEIKIFEINSSSQETFSKYNRHPVVFNPFVYSKGVFRTQSNINDRDFLRKSVNYFCKKAPSYMLDWVLNTPLYSVKNFWGITKRSKKAEPNPICEESIDCIGAGNEMVNYDLKRHRWFHK